ncbi:MFS transporter [Calothrix sp. FACHB-1219]|uniref:MFS transporter n=1 Tax=unclassified Calothrix TaxID=2619626 RepID=UPI0016852858|nr:MULTISPECIES: MFS transporter [unclassified Calothrix]MBD2202933.1 MFS transporter [Calothrix sp. FACHB-168]MBD2216061.1 MFS transporter [Calothrix sp. FACHB-1219]
MELKHTWLTANKGIPSRLLHWLNLRPEETERTWLMFVFYTIVSVGLRWAEDSTVALFLDEYGANPLPLVYMASAALGFGLVFLYSGLQKIFPLRWVIVAIAPCMVTPLLILVFLHSGIQISYWTIILVFLMRLWVDALYVVNDLNTSIVANQLFNIREIKRTYPLVSSGLLVADVISGFSLPWLLAFAKLNKVIIIACVLIIFGTGILFYLSHHYREAFPDAPQKLNFQEATARHRRLEVPLRRYIWLLFGFVGLLQVIGLLIDFQYLRELKSNFGEKDLASFLGLFGGIVGLCELMTQWFISSRLIERLGVFFAAALLPITVGCLIPAGITFFNVITGVELPNFFWGLVILKFCDELLRYTFIMSSGPALYQPIPERIRNRTQILSGGTAEAIATGLAGVVIFVTLIFCDRYVPEDLRKWVFIVETVIVAAICLRVVMLLRSRYVDLLVFSADRGELSAANVGLRVFQQGVVKALGEKGSLADKRSCIELLAQIDLHGAVEVLAPLLVKLPPDLQCQSLEVMLMAEAQPIYLPYVRPLLEQSEDNVTPEVFALALRYVWLAEPHPNLSLLEEYLHPRQHSLIRATAAALLLRQGTPMQKVAATKAMRRMLTHKNERERVNGVKALREAVYLQALRVHIPNLLQDESLRVRCAVLDMIAATKLEEYYAALLGALYYKSTRNTAMRALVQLENEAIEMLLDLATNIYKPELVRVYAWRTIAQIGTSEAVDCLWQNLEQSWGSSRIHILRSLLKIHKQPEIKSLEDKFYESRVENLIKEELKFLGSIYAAYIDFTLLQTINNQQAKEVFDLLQRALLELEMDVKERLLLLLKLLYSPDKMQAAAFNIRSDSNINLARGLEILDHTVNLSCKSLLLNILDRRSYEEKLYLLTASGLVEYQQLSISDRLRQLLMISNFLSDWCLACCFHFAKVSQIRLTIPEIMIALRHPTGFVREAAIAYLSVVSHRFIIQLLPQLQKDKHPLVVAQVKKLMAQYTEQNYRIEQEV